MGRLGDDGEVPSLDAHSLDGQVPPPDGNSLDGGTDARADGGRLGDATTHDGQSADGSQPDAGTCNRPTQVMVCGRDPEGIVCGASNRTDAFSVDRWQTSFRDESGWGAQLHNWATIRFPDINGDGHADICGRGYQGVICGLSDGVGAFGDVTLWLDAFSTPNGWADGPQYWATIQFADVNGDGSDDVCGRGPTGVACALSNTTHGFEGYPSFASGFSDASGYAAANHWGTLQFADLNGDGAADLCARGSRGLMCTRSTGTGFEELTIWNDDLTDDAYGGAPSYWATLQFPDINGDGMADVCTRWATGVHCATSTGSAFSELVLWSGLFADASSGGDHPSYWGTMQFPDVNGDGSDDFCAKGTRGLWCATSSGTNFENASLWNTSFRDDAGWTSVTYWSTIAFADINADGSEDVCARRYNGYACALSNGRDSFGELTTWSDIFSNDNGWHADPSYYRTIRLAQLSGCQLSEPGSALPWATGAVPPRTPD